MRRSKRLSSASSHATTRLRCFHGAYTLPCRKMRADVRLATKHGIGNTRLALRGRLRLLLTLRCGSNRGIRRTIGDALERFRDAGQLERNLVGSAGPLQHDDPFSTEVKRSPEQQSRHNRHENHDQVVARDGDASAGKSNQVIREQSFLLGWALRFTGLRLDESKAGLLRVVLALELRR